VAVPRGRVVLPAALAERARRFARGGVSEVAPRLAATVALLRDRSAGLEVYLLQRLRSMAFAGGMYAFPGGAVDPSDGDVVEAAIRELYEETGVLLARRDQLASWAHWITPVFEERRYDTHFFVAAVPAGQEARDVSGEASSAGWMSPSEALAQLERGQIAMLPPTAVTLAELAEYETASAVLAAATSRAVVPITPQAVIDGEIVRLALPGDPEWLP
jgi:8-oxo-dGTP pyrophosphatase MutT (NUDIX family)